MRTLWRLHIRPYGGDADHALALSHCLERSVVGMGWSLPNEPVTESDDFGWYEEAAVRQYPGNSWFSVRTFAEAAMGDLVWFRNLEGRYYLAELTGRWRYCYREPWGIAADIVNYRPARIVEVGLADAVPGKVISCFRPARTFQAIRSPGMLAFSARCLGLSEAGDTLIDLYEFMSDADIENLVFVYLQVIGWYVLPGTRMVNTAHYEFVLVHRDNGERAIVQVKSGGTSIDASTYNGEERAFLFAASGHYGALVPPNVTVIHRSDLNAFMRERPELLPRAVQTWMAVAGLPRNVG